MDINQIQDWYHNKSNPCFVVNITAGHSIWQNENPLTQALPLLATQLSIVIFVCRAIYFILRPLKIPRFAADLLGGVLLGPTALRKIRFFDVLFPLRSTMIVETVAFWALTCHMFLVGLEMDVVSVLGSGMKTVRFAVSAVVIPFIAGIFLFLLMNSTVKDYQGWGSVFYGAVLAVTGFPIVARVLSDVKLLHTEIGRMAMSTSMIVDLFAWILLSVVLPFDISITNGVGVIMATIGFVVFSIYAVRPVLKTIIKYTAGENNYFGEHYLCIVLVSISLFAVTTEVLGMHSIAGAFVLGLIIPNKVLGSVFAEKFEDFLTGYMLPLFFTVCGLRANPGCIENWPIALVVLILACSVKVLSTLLASNMFDLPHDEALSLGVLMNTKGVLAIVILLMGFDSSTLKCQDFTVLVFAILLMTGMVPMVMTALYHPSKRRPNYSRRTIQKAKTDNDFRILACLHNFNNVQGMIPLLDCSHPTRQSPVFISVLHLVEITGRASATLIVHNPNKSNTSSQSYFRRNPESEQIFSALHTFAELNEFISLQAITALSPVATMHEDICSLAEDKEIALLIVPFHKVASPEGKLEGEISASFRGVNVNVMANAPCSVAIFVDRGFGAAESNLTMRQVAMLFIGGPDDREALAYAWRMAGGHGVTLTVVRFLPGDQVEKIESIDAAFGEAHRLITSVSYVDMQKRLDDEYVNEFRLKSAGEQHITYQEKVVNNDEETVSALKEMHHMFDLYVVGKGEGVVSPLTAGLADWCEYPELGAIGDLLVTSSFAQGSVLVVQQYAGDGEGNYLSDGLSIHESDDSENGTDHLGNWKPASPEGTNGSGLEMEPFARRKSRDYDLNQM